MFLDLKIVFMNFFTKNSNKFIIIFSTTFLAVLAVYYFYMPFYGDQAFFITGANVIREGGVLYKDFWDFKQPGIFYFYWLGGAIFSYSEEGIHLFEIFYWTLFSLALIYLSIKGRIFNNKLLNYILPLFTIGIYFNISDKTSLTQVEILSSVPFIIIILLLHNYRKTKRFDIYIIIGILISFILLLKLVFAIAIVCLIIFHFILLFKDRVSIWTIVAYKFLPLLLGFIVATIPFILYVYRNNIVDLVYNTFFVAPFEVISDVQQKSPIVFFENLVKFSVKTFPLFIFSSLVIIQNFRKRSELLSMLTIFIFTGTYIIYMQKFSYWSYQYMILLFPIGILTLIFFDNFYKSGFYDVVTRKLQPGMKFFSVLFFLIILFGVQEYFFAKKTKVFLNYFPLKETSRTNYKDNYNLNYESNVEAAKYVKNKKDSFNIFVCGSPMIYYLSNRKQAIPSNGWALELFSEKRWLILKKEISQNKPQYIYISNSYNSLVRSKNIIDFETEYIEAEICKDGTWYKNVNK